MATDSFTSVGSHTWECPDDQTVTLKLWGAGGGDGHKGNLFSYYPGSGADGGYVEIDVSVARNETLDLYVGERGENGGDGVGGHGGTGYKSGGNAGDTYYYDSDDYSGGGGGGGGATAVLNGTDSVIGSAGGGGGGGGSRGSTAIGGAGGGGARGGTGGDGAGSTGKDGNGTGAGGAGGNDESSGSSGSYVHNLGTLVSGSSGGGNSGDGQVDVVYTQPPAAPSSVSASGSGNDISVSWTDNSGSEDGFNVYRATSSGSVLSDYTKVGSVGADVTSYTDTVPNDGEKYYYVVVAEEGGLESALSNEVAMVSDLPSPGSFSIDAINGDQYEVSWSDNHNYGHVQIEVSTDGGSTWSVNKDNIARGSSPQLTNSLSSADEHTVRVTAATEHTESPSGTATEVLAGAAFRMVDSALKTNGDGVIMTE